MITLQPIGRVRTARTVAEAEFLVVRNGSQDDRTLSQLIRAHCIVGA